MPDINHNAVLATGNSEELALITDWIAKVDERYKKLFVVVPGIGNDFVTVVLVPDGGNELWELSDTLDIIRESFIRMVNELKCWRWVEVGYGEYGQAITRGNNENKHSREKYAGVIYDPNWVNLPQEVIE